MNWLPVIFRLGLSRGRAVIQRGWSLRAGMAALIMASTLAQAELNPDQKAALPAPAKDRVNFSRDLQPILEASCIKCHGRGRAKGGFSMENRESILKGGQTGPAVVPGKSAESYLIELVSGLNAESVMPQKGTRLTPRQVGLLRAWIDQGLPWAEPVNFSRPAPANLVPRQPALPSQTEGMRSDNPIDLLLRPYFESRQIQVPQPVADRVFIRRVYLDILGLLPAPEQMEAFLEDREPGKRKRLVHELLANHQRYAEHWLTFWNDALRNDYQGTGYIDGGRKQISAWLYSALAQNMPYNQFVAHLVNPDAESEGFINGITWRGVVNASQTPQMQAAQNISQVFLGVNLKCASCHDSFINDWTLADAYGMAGIYADGPLEMFHCDKPTGQKAALKFLYPELGSIDARLDQTQRRQRLAEILTAKENGRLTRTMVNRLWAKFMGRGLVEPVEEMDKPAWHPDLLDWLAADLAEGGYDLKRTIALILTSEAYQLPADPEALQRQNYEFHGPQVRRMDAEQYLDAVSSLTGVWHLLPANGEINFDAAPEHEFQTHRTNATAQGKWIGRNRRDGNDRAPQALYLRKTITLDEAPAEAAIVCAGDHHFNLYLNGQQVVSGDNFRIPRLVDGMPYLVKGENLITVEVTQRPADPKQPDASVSGPAFLLSARIRAEVRTDGHATMSVADFGTDSSWIANTDALENWEKPGYLPAAWNSADELGSMEAKPWQVAGAFSATLSCAAQYNRVRAALVPSDPLMTALGRPNREQTVMSRADAATTLQALELTNGSTLARLLDRGARKLLVDQPRPGRDLLVRLYRHALGRPPTETELALTTKMAGDPVKPEGLEDTLWALLMLPEFQLIY